MGEGAGGWGGVWSSKKVGVGLKSFRWSKESEKKKKEQFGFESLETPQKVFFLTKSVTISSKEENKKGSLGRTGITNQMRLQGVK